MFASRYSCECDLLYVADILALVFLNPGPWSIDRTHLINTATPKRLG